MDDLFDFSKEYGIVLEGGGAKGAYQIGVWKAFLECEVKIKGVSGVSVGALNGALICMGNYEEAETLWSEISYSDVMKVNDEQMDKVVKGQLKELDIKELTKNTAEIIAEGGIDVTPLKKLISRSIDEDKIKNSDIEFIMGTFSLTELKELEISAREADRNYIKDYLLASSYLPGFRNEKLHGKKYLDGGMFNNVPLNMLINRGYKNIIVVRIYGIGMEKHVKIPEDVNVIEIAPRVDLGGILEFDNVKCRRNMMIGYFDALRILRSLKGKVYYMDAKLSDEECLEKLIQVKDVVKMAFLEFYKQDYTKIHIYTRVFLEVVCPSLAVQLKLNKDWTYQELYISLLELCAKTLRIAKYKIYTEEELNQLVKAKYSQSTSLGKQYPIFVQLVLKMITI